MSAALTFDGGSFKDPSGRVFHHAGRVFRGLNAEGRAQFDDLVASGLYAALHEAGQLVTTTRIDPAAAGLGDTGLGESILEHEPIPFVTYPYEWGSAQLRDAALLTLDVLARALEHDFILKDATPFNVQFRDAAPVFIDVLSFERYEPGTPWRGYAQFCSSFLYPLLLAAYRGLAFQPLLRGTLGTLTSTQVSPLFGWRDLLRPGVLVHVKLAARLQRSFADAGQPIDSRVKQVRFSKEMVLANVAGLRKLLGKLRVGERDSAWADYASTHSYSAEDQQAKETFVRETLARLHPGWVWDLGCNVGVYSQIAAEAGARVLAIDGDPAAIDRLYVAQRAGERSPRIQPLVGDLANPSPDLGWALAERRSWWARGKADAFLALALVHHLAIGGNVPLAEVVRFLAGVAPAGVVEFVAKADPMVQRLLSTRQDVFPDYTEPQFRACLEAHFRIVRAETSGSGTRALYELAPLG